MELRAYREAGDGRLKVKLAAPDLESSNTLRI
jgi:hypothetical protein